MRFTLTHVVWFSEDELEPLREQVRALCADWETRRPYVDRGTHAAGERRLRLLVDAVGLLAEPVPEPL